MLLPDLQPLSDRAAVFTHLAQQLLAEHLEETLGRHRWESDLDERRLSFVSEERDARLDTRMTIVATVAPGPRSLLWGWSHPQMEAMSLPATREYGEQHDVASLTAAEVSLGTDAQGEELVADLVEVTHTVARAAIAVTGPSHYYSAPAGGGTRLVTLVAAPELPTVRIDHRFGTRVPAALATGLVEDHRLAVQGLADLAGFCAEWAPEWASVRLTDPVTDNSVECEFDEQSRLTRLSGSVGGDLDGPQAQS